MTEFPNMPHVVGGCLCYGGECPCVCGESERVLRAYADAYLGLPPMDAAQRLWCLREIGRVEGHDQEALNLAHESDARVASGVLNAWREYARDKGLY